MAPKTEITTIKLEKKTKERLEKLKIHKRESYDETLKQILTILNICKANPDAARRKLIRIDRARQTTRQSQSLISSKTQAKQAPQRSPRSL